MRKFLLFTTTSILVVLGMKVAFANPAHHTGTQTATQELMMTDSQIDNGMMGNGSTGSGMMSGGMMGNGAMGSGMIPGGMMGNGTTGSGMMSGGMMMNPDMMIIMLDTDGDGSLSLEEFQSLHARMFNYMDENKDGKLEASEFATHHADSAPIANTKQN